MKPSLRDQGYTIDVTEKYNEIMGVAAATPVMELELARHRRRLAELRKEIMGYEEVIQAYEIVIARLNAPLQLRVGNAPR